jgi:hypothetical protein
LQGGGQEFEPPRLHQTSSHDGGKIDRRPRPAPTGANEEAHSILAAYDEGGSRNRIADILVTELRAA